MADETKSERVTLEASVRSGRDDRCFAAGIKRSSLKSIFYRWSAILIKIEAAL